MNTMMLLEMAKDGFGQRIALGSRSGGRSYAELYEAAGRAASTFSESDVETVGYAGLSSETFPVALFAAGWAGLPFAPLNYRLDQETLCSLAGRISPAFMIADPAQAELVCDVDGLTIADTSEFGGSLSQGELSDSAWGAGGDDTAVLLFTSGTTGTPKAAVLRHKHLVSYILGSVEFMGAGEDEATLVSVPPYHIAGIAAILSSVYSGRRIVQLPQFDADTWIDLAIEESITHAMVVPTMLTRIVERLDERGLTLPGVRALSYGGGKMGASTIERALDLMPHTAFVNAYGLTETSSTIALLDADSHREAHASDDPKVRQRLGSVGRPLPSIELSLRDDFGKEVPAGEPGEIWVRGEQVSGEYVGIGSLVDDDGWFHTNDEAWLDDGGYLYIVGRRDDVIVRGGENISPGEIEDILAGHVAVSDAACVGVPDEQWGEVVAAAIVRSDGVEVTGDELCEHVRTSLRSSKVPAKVVFVDELPYNDTGKLLRRVLREQLD